MSTQISVMRISPCFDENKAKVRISYGPTLSAAAGNPVTLLVSETTGALSTAFVRCLRELGQQSRAPATHDSTRYGTSPASPRSYYAHHLAAISAAIVYADALTVLNAAAHLSFLLSVGLEP